MGGDEKSFDMTVAGSDVRIINGDCLDAMQELEPDSIDAIVTDPPYGIAFMGAKWDSFGSSTGRETIDERRQKMNEYLGSNAIVPAFASSHARMPTLSEMHEFQDVMTPIFIEAFRIAKPGAHLLCFGGTRTFHRVACAIEDAGWGIRDTIMWVYGSGFPKSMDVSKAIDKALGAKRPVVGKVKKLDSYGYDGNNTYGDGPDHNGVMEITEPATSESEQWDGWGTCLKPAWEPIIVARKPLDGTVAHNVMTHGTGAINIDGCRVPTSDKLGGGMRAGGAEGVWDRPFMHDKQAQADFVERKKVNVEKAEKLGRFPANLVHDESEEVLALFPDSNCGKSGPTTHHIDGQRNSFGVFNNQDGVETYRHGGNGSAARFFYCAKASKKDRGEGNDHPTVKPNDLMRWLVRLVCREGGVVLDPFMGSGSTGVACVDEGMGFIGIELDGHYCDIAKKRISDAGGTQMALF